MAAVQRAAANAGVAAQPAVPAAVPAAAPPVVPFALTPGLATQGIIDFSTSDGKKFYYQAAKYDTSNMNKIYMTKVKRRQFQI